MNGEQRIRRVVEAKGYQLVSAEKLSWCDDNGEQGGCFVMTEPESDSGAGYNWGEYLDEAIVRLKHELPEAE